MFNLKTIINIFYDIINKKQTFFEIILNLSFILIILIIATIFYWDSINRTIINTSRCKIMINNDDSEYNLYVYDKDQQNKLYKISYDNNKNHNIKIDCACPTGDIANNINIPYYDFKDQKVYNDLNKQCLCDKNYDSSYNTKDYKYEGDAFLIDFYKDMYNTLNTHSTYTNKLNFPS